jgi:peptidoglycan/LPS O-acetylase OafA/YrhL
MTTVMKKNYHVGFDYLRVLAMIFVMWPHLGLNLNPSWSIGIIVNKYINNPLSIGSNFGILGVCIFFIISGYLLSEQMIYRQNRNVLSILMKRLKGILLPLWFYMICFFCLVQVLGVLGINTYWSQFNFVEWIKSCTLYHFIFDGQAELVNGVLWYLLPYFIFVVFASIIGTLIKKVKYLVLYLQSIILISICIASLWTNHLAMFNFIIFIAIPVYGIIMCFYKMNLFCLKEAIVYGIINSLVFAIGLITLRPDLYYNEHYFVSVIYSVIIIISILGFESKLKENYLVTQISNYSFCFYIIHSLYGGMIISYLWGGRGWDYTIVWIIALVLNNIISYFSTMIYKKIAIKLSLK